MAFLQNVMAYFTEFINYTYFPTKNTCSQQRNGSTSLYHSDILVYKPGRIAGDECVVVFIPPSSSMKEANMSLPVSMGSLFQAALEEDAAHRDDGLCVVGIFGKSNMQSGPPKESLINTLADKHIFSLFGVPEDDGGGTADSHIQAFYNQESRVLYLLLSSVSDSRQLLRACQSLSAGIGHSDAHDFWKGLDRQHCLHLLYMFSVCHVLLLVHPNQTFDVSYDRLFRALDALRQKVLPLIRAAIKDCPVSKEWKVNCRPCPPRLLFVFQMNGSLKVRCLITSF